MENISTEELMKIAEFGNQQSNDVSSMSNKELMKIASAKPKNELVGKKGKIVGGIVGEAIEDPKSLKALGRGALDTATFGFADEIVGGVKSIAKGTPYKEERDIYRAESKKLEEKYPEQTIVGQIGGAFVPGTGIAKGVGAVIKGTGKLAKVGRIAGIGAVEGGLYGAGKTEDIKDVPQTLQDIKDYALYGAGAGVGMQAIAKVGGLVAKPFKGRVSPVKSEASKLKKTLTREGFTPEKARESLQKMQEEGKMLIDVIDPRSSLISQIPERTFEKATIETVDNYSKQLDRIGNKTKDEVLNLMSKNTISPMEASELIGQNASEIIKRQKKIRSEKAKPLYEKANKDIIPENDEIFNIPVVQEAIQKAKEEAAKFGEETVGNLTNIADEIPSYSMSHRPTKTGATADDITLKGEYIPSDFYTHPHYYGVNLREKSYIESFSTLQKIKGKPETEVTIYRASPKNELNNGDWVTLSKEYAKGEALLENVPVNSFKVKAKDIQFAGDDINEFGYYPKKINLPDNSIAVLHQAKDYLYRKSKDFTDLESARYGQVYRQLQNKLEKASPSYKEATKIWKGETEGLEELYKQKGIGNLAKKYDKNDIDGIRSSVKNVFKKTMSDEEVGRLKKNLPQEQFNAIIRKDLETVIDEGKEAGLQDKRLDLIFSKEQKSGFEKMSEVLDRIKTREKQIDKIAFRTPKQQLTYIYSGQYAIANAILKGVRLISDNPAQREAFANFLFTTQGKELLEQIAKGDKQQIEKIIASTLPLILKQKEEKDDTGI